MLLLFLGWIGKIVHNFIKLFINGKFDKSDESKVYYLNIDKNDFVHVLDKREEADVKQLSEINNILDSNLFELREKLHMKGAWIGRFHDNKNTFNTYPNDDKWLVFSITNASHINDSENIKNKLRHIPLILLKPILDDIYKSGYFYTNDILSLPASLYYIFKRLKIFSVCAVGIFDKDENLIAIIGIEKNKKIELTKDIIDEINTTGQNISNILGLIKKNKLMWN